MASEIGPSSAALTAARFRALAGFEVRAQGREPLTTLYALVFGLLALGYASGDAVELVRHRGDVPRTSAWALMLAFGGLTAFGQVITTMIATTAMLRDEALGVRGLVATTGVSPRTWLLARLAGAWVVMLLVYLAMPLGVMAGTAARSLALGEPLLLIPVAYHAMRAWLVLTVPTTLVVTVCLAAAAVRTQRVLGVLLAALGLVAVWQTALTVAQRPGWHVAGALLDPFGNAPLLVESATWSAAVRTTSVVPLTGLLLANRFIWLVLALAVLGWLLTAGSARVFAPSAPPMRSQHGRRHARFLRALAASTSAHASLRHFTRGWITLDGGWRVVSALAVLNAGVNAWGTVSTPAGTGGPVAVLMAVHTHARLFLILLATVYAGELVWRERDVRMDGVLNAVGVSPGVLFAGRLAGLAQAQLAVIVPLALLGLAGALLASSGATGQGVAATLAVWIVWSAFVLWLPFVQLTALSLAVHAVLDHKVGAHLLLITGWVLAVVLDRQGVSAWWVRFADPAPLWLDGGIPWRWHAQRGAYWCAVGAALLWLAYRRWPAGARRSLTSRR